MTNIDEIHALAADIKRYSMGDARIDECVEEMLKRVESEFNALMLEIRDAPERARYCEVCHWLVIDGVCNHCDRNEYARSEIVRQGDSTRHQ